MRYFVNDGKINRAAKLPRAGDSVIAKLVNLISAKMGTSLEETSDKKLLDFLVGKKVRLQTSNGVFNRKKWFRNDIVEIL